MDQGNDPELPAQENDDVSDALCIALNATVEQGSSTEAQANPLYSELAKAGASAAGEGLL